MRTTIEQSRKTIGTYEGILAENERCLKQKIDEVMPDYSDVPTCTVTPNLAKLQRDRVLKKRGTSALDSCLVEKRKSTPLVRDKSVEMAKPRRTITSRMEFMPMYKERVATAKA